MLLESFTRSRFQKLIKLTPEYHAPPIFASNTLTPQDFHFSPELLNLRMLFLQFRIPFLQF